MTRRRPDRKRRGFGVVTVVWFLVTVAGVGLATYTSYLLVREPFLGRAPLPRTLVLPTFAGFIVGIILFGWGASRLEAALLR